MLAAIYGCCYGVTEIAGLGRLAVPGRRWQVPQSMLIDASPWRRVLVWGAVLGPGFATRNPYAGFGLLPIAVVAMAAFQPAAGVALAAVIGLAHGGARATALLRDIASGQQIAALDASGQLGSAAAHGVLASAGRGNAARRGRDRDSGVGESFLT